MRRLRKCTSVCSSFSRVHKIPHIEQTAAFCFLMDTPQKSFSLLYFLFLFSLVLLRHLTKRCLSFYIQTKETLDPSRQESRERRKRHKRGTRESQKRNCLRRSEPKQARKQPTKHCTTVDSFSIRVCVFFPMSAPCPLAPDSWYHHHHHNNNIKTTRSLLSSSSLSLAAAMDPSLVLSSSSSSSWLLDPQLLWTHSSCNHKNKSLSVSKKLLRLGLATPTTTTRPTQHVFLQQQPFGSNHHPNNNNRVRMTPQQQCLPNKRRTRRSAPLLQCPRTITSRQQRTTFTRVQDETTTTTTRNHHHQQHNVTTTTTTRPWCHDATKTTSRNNTTRDLVASSLAPPELSSLQPQQQQQPLPPEQQRGNQQQQPPSTTRTIRSKPPATTPMPCAITTTTPRRRRKGLKTAQEIRRQFLARLGILQQQPSTLGNQNHHNRTSATNTTTTHQRSAPFQRQRPPSVSSLSSSYQQALQGEDPPDHDGGGQDVLLIHDEDADRVVNVGSVPTILLQEQDTHTTGNHRIKDTPGNHRNKNNKSENHHCPPQQQEQQPKHGGPCHSSTTSTTKRNPMRTSKTLDDKRGTSPVSVREYPPPSTRVLLTDSHNKNKNYQQGDAVCDDPMDGPDHTTTRTTKHCAVTTTRCSVQKNNNNKNHKKHVSFYPHVTVHVIPHYQSYSRRMHHLLWTSSRESRIEAARNCLEFAADQWDWRQAANDEDYRFCRGQWLHPIHFVVAAGHHHATDSNHNTYSHSPYSSEYSSPCSWRQQRTRRRSTYCTKSIHGRGASPAVVTAAIGNDTASSSPPTTSKTLTTTASCPTAAGLRNLRRA